MTSALSGRLSDARPAAGRLPGGAELHACALLVLRQLRVRRHSEEGEAAALHRRPRLERQSAPAVYRSVAGSPAVYWSAGEGRGVTVAVGSEAVYL